MKDKARFSGSLLPQVSEQSIQCKCCRNGIAWGLMSMSNKEIKDKLDSDESFFPMFKDVITEWEARTNAHFDASGGKSSKSNAGVGELPDHLAEKLHVVTATGLEAEVVLGNLWPSKVYEREKKQKIRRGGCRKLASAGPHM